MQKETQPTPYLSRRGMEICVVAQITSGRLVTK